MRERYDEYIASHFHTCVHYGDIYDFSCSCMSFCTRVIRNETRGASEFLHWERSLDLDDWCASVGKKHVRLTQYHVQTCARDRIGPLRNLHSSSRGGWFLKCLHSRLMPTLAESRIKRELLRAQPSNQIPAITHRVLEKAFGVH